jgi:hypothetical protein
LTGAGLPARHLGLKGVLGVLASFETNFVTPVLGVMALMTCAWLLLRRVLKRRPAPPEGEVPQPWTRTTIQLVVILVLSAHYWSFWLFLAYWNLVGACPKDAPACVTNQARLFAGIGILVAGWLLYVVIIALARRGLAWAASDRTRP